MRDQFIKSLKSRSTWNWILICAVLSVLYGILRSPFWLHFIDGIFISGFILLIFFLIRNSWMEGDFSFFHWRPKNGSYMDYREKIAKERRKEGNPLLLPALILIISGMILSILYH